MNIKSMIYTGKLKIDFKPTLAFLFYEVSKNKDVEELYKKLKILNPDMEVVGVNGQSGSINNNIPFIIEDKISCLFFDIDKSAFFIKLLDIYDDIESKFFRSMSSFDNTASIIFTPFEYDVNSFLDNVKQNLTDIYGGIYANEDNKSLFYNGKFFKSYILSVFFNQDIIKFFSLAVHGFQPIGINLKVTKAEGNKIYELNHIPALEFLEDYMGEIKQENIDNFVHPFYVHHKGYNSLASIKSIDKKEKSIELFKYVYEDESIQVAVPLNQNNVMNLLDKRLVDIECDGLFMFSCIGRYAYHKNLLEFEIAKVAETMGKSFAGFLSWGEIGSNDINTKSILQNQTMDLVFFKVQK